MPFGVLEAFESSQKDTLMDFFPGGKMELPFEFFLEPGETTITFDKSVSGATINGKSDVLDFELLKQAKSEVEKKMELSLNDLRKCRDPETKECLEEFSRQFRNMQRQIHNDIYLDYYNKHLHSELALYALKESIPATIDSPTLYLERLSRLPKKIKDFPEAKYLKTFLEAVRNSYPGKYVRDFYQFDTAGNQFAFKSIPNKYVLLNFWSSTQLANNFILAELKSIWSKYSDKNFTIISIGLETIASKENWLRTIRQKKLPWIQLTDYRGLQNEAARQFGVLFVPFNLLIDPEGKIVSRNIERDELVHFLSSVLK